MEKNKKRTPSKIRKLYIAKLVARCLIMLFAFYLCFMHREQFDVIESFFGRFKDVLRSHFRYWKCDDLQKVIDETIYYFNYVKPMRKLKRKPPVQYRLEQAA